eukprot:Clim_evm2s76 gene=Clim_evmTU2s76
MKSSILFVCALAIAGAMGAPTEQDQVAQFKDAAAEVTAQANADYHAAYVRIFGQEPVGGCSMIPSAPCSKNSDCCFGSCHDAYPVGTCDW